MNSGLFRKIAVVFAAVLCAVSMTACGQKSFAAAKKIDAPTAELTIYAFDGESEKVWGLLNLGHAFVSVKNVTAAPLIVGGYSVAAGDEVSIGTWGMNAHWGIWYNVESTYMTLGRYDGRVSMTQQISAGEVDIINAYLKVSDKWTPFKNCSYFAMDLWNSVADKDESVDLGGLVTPSRVAQRIAATEGYSENRPITDFGGVGYYLDESGEFFPFELRED